MVAQPTAQRLSIMLGLLAAGLVSLPRYMADGQETRLSLLVLICAVLAGVAIAHWRLLKGESRARLPGLLARLTGCLAAGAALMGGWQALFGGWAGWELWLSHGATLGLLIHVFSLWWRS